MNFTAGVGWLRGISVPNPKVWSPGAPNLHTVEVAVGGGAVLERFGLRTFGVDAATARLTVNGKVAKLTGWNHHTQWPGQAGKATLVTASPTDAQLDDDIRLLAEGGCTYVRGAHYPQDPRWLDRLDEAGMLMWEETLGPGVSVANTEDAAWRAVQRKQLDEMLDNAMNHAAILTWGWFNEGPSDRAEACPAYAENAARVHERDPTRFGTWASNKKLKDVCLAHATLIAFNSYPAWYGGTGDLGEPARFWNEQAAAVFNGSTASGAAATVGKPLVISETGAGGIYEWDHNATDAQWTLRYQSEVILADVDVALSNERISGITLWHFFDFKVNDAAENGTACQYAPGVFPPTCTSIALSFRPGGENHKGVVDFWRRPKPAFAQVAARFNASRLDRLPAQAVVEAA